MASWIEDNRRSDEAMQRRIAENRAATGRLRDRHDRIHRQLKFLQDHGIIGDFYTVGGSELRWNLRVRTGETRAFTTVQVEAFILGAEAAQK